MLERIFGRDETYFQKHDALTTSTEIAQQPRLWRELVGLLRQQEEEITTFVDKMKAISGLRIIFTGAGSSAFVGQALQMMFARENGLRGEAIATTDIVSVPDCVLYDAPTLLVSFSRSGESPESLAALEYAAKRIRNLYNLVVVCKKGSTLANYAAHETDTLLLNMPPESSDAGFAMTSSVSCMALGTYCVFNWERRNEVMEHIERLADYVEAEMHSMDRFALDVVKFDYRRLIYLGSGALRGLAQEGAVKSLELTNGKINSSSDSPMAFRHGPKTVVNSHTLTVHFISPDSLTSKYDLDVLKELAREKTQNRQLALVTEGVVVPEGVDYALHSAISGGVFAELSVYIVNLVFLQLLSLEKSIATGTPTDNPSVGGEVNRVVRGVTIYEL